MKKIIIFLLAILCLSGCAAKHVPEPQPEQSTQQPENVEQPEITQQPEKEEQPEQITQQPDIYAEPVTDPSLEKNKGELQDTELASIVAKYLGVPDMTDVTYEIGEKLYWEAGQRYYKYVTFCQNGEMIASASVDLSDGKLIKSIQMYQEKTEEEFE